MSRLFQLSSCPVGPRCPGGPGRAVLRRPPRPAGTAPSGGGSGGGPAHLEHGAKPRPPVSCPRSSPGSPGPRTAKAARPDPATHTQRGPSPAGRAGAEEVSERDPRAPLGDTVLGDGDTPIAGTHFLLKTPPHPTTARCDFNGPSDTYACLIS